MKITNHMLCISALLAVALFAFACAEKGKSGSEGLDCGEFGSAHGEHCHCNDGYFLDGETCVQPEEITEVCETRQADPGDADTATASEHLDETCVCPSEGKCPCEGDLSTYGGKDYCTPKLHEE